MDVNMDVKLMGSPCKIPGLSTTRRTWKNQLF